MLPVGLDELAREADAFDAAVARTPAIDRFCSSSAWVLAAHDALMGPREPWVLRGEGGWVATAIAERHSGVMYVEPLELAWGLACPIIGDPRAVAPGFIRAAAARRDWNIMLLA